MDSTGTLRDEPTVKLTTRVPETLINLAQAKFPGALPAVIVRIALARMLGIDDGQFVTPLQHGPKPRKRLTAD